MFLGFVACILIPAYTILFVADSNWFTTNFSVLGNEIGQQEKFVLWGLIVGIYFFWCLRRIVASMPVSPWGTWLIPFDLLLLVFAITTPYLPDRFPIQAFLHFMFAFFSAIVLAIILLLIIWKLYQTDPGQFRPFLFGLGIITAVSFALLSKAGFVNSALEIFVTISGSILVYRLYRRVVTT